TAIDKQGLLGAGFSQPDINAIENDVNQFGLNEVLKGITDQKQIDALNKVYGNTVVKKVTRPQLETTITSKVAYDGMKDAFTEKELKQFADESGDSSFWTGKGTDIERYLNSAAAKKKYIDLLYEQYKTAGMAD
ncbi:MAG TPA: hypothetical protein DCR71_03755, partial [Dehalococcoidia bacterium]|nr:hypothetical protein [Dehalococcoidia bacterium]